MNVAEANGVEEGDVIHFFVDDNRLKGLERRKYIPLVYRKALAVCSPDFSLYLKDNIEIWRKNIDRKNRLAKQWRAKGIRVIDTVTWATRESFDFCFEGIKKYSIVAISVQGIDDWNVFWEGFEEMKKRLRPKVILCYGTSVLLEADCEILYFKTFVEEKWRGQWVAEGQEDEVAVVPGVAL